MRICSTFGTRIEAPWMSAPPQRARQETGFLLAPEKGLRDLPRLCQADRHPGLDPPQNRERGPFGELGDLGPDT